MATFSQQEIYNRLLAGGVPQKDAQILAATAKGESGLRTDAVGDAGNSFGLFQIYIPAHYPKLEAFTGSPNRYVWEDWLKDPINNIKAAIAVYNSQGLGAWTIYNTGAYKQYLNDIDTSGSAWPLSDYTGGTITEDTRNPFQRSLDQFRLKLGLKTDEISENAAAFGGDIKSGILPFDISGVVTGVIIAIIVIFMGVFLLNALKGSDANNG